MLIAEVSATVENLAILVHKKSNELAKLQKEYHEKLEILNKYIGKIAENTQYLEIVENPEQSQTSQKSGKLQNSSETTDNTLLKIISTPVCCPLCLNTLYDLSFNSDFVLIPRNKVHLIGDGDEGHTVEKVESAMESLQVSEKQVSKKHGKLKKTCSYCKKPGHSRARCFTRLSKDPSEPQSLLNRASVDPLLPDSTL